MKKSTIVVNAIAMLSGITLAGTASAEVIASTDFTGRTVSGATAQNITWTVNGVADPGDLTAVDIDGAAPPVFDLFGDDGGDSGDSAGHFAPDLNVDNEGPWSVTVTLNLTVSLASITNVVLDYQHFSNSGGYQSAGRLVNWTVTVTGSVSGQLGSEQAIGVSSTSGTETLVFSPALNLTDAETYTVKILAETGGGSGNNTGLDALAINGTISTGPGPVTSSFQEGVSPTAGYTHDAVMIRSNQASSNQDGAGSIIIGLAQAGNEILRGLFEFDVSDIPSGDQIESVSLTLKTLSSSAGINNVGGPGALTTFNVYTHAYDIDETTATWNVPGGGAPAGGSTNGTLLSSVSIDVEVTGQTVTFGDTSAFRDAVAGALSGDGVLRLIIANNDESNLGTHDFARYEDNEDGTAANRPELIVAHTAQAPDTDPPVVQTRVPADDATDVSITANLVITFDENVQAGSGNIVIKQSSDDSTVETIDVQTGPVTFNNTEVTIDPAGDLAYNTGYYVEMASGVLVDQAATPNPFGGYSGSGAWNFTTLATPDTDPPEVLLLDPFDGETDVSVADLVATFNESIALTGSGTITLKNLSGGADVTITLPDDVSILDNVLTITPASALAFSTEYAVEISDNAIADLYGNAYAGLLATDDPNWSFTTGEPSTACDMLTLSWGGNNATFDGLAVTLQVPAGTDLGALNPTYTTSDFATGSPLSGTAPGFDSANPQTYTITAQNGSDFQDYTVTVVVLPPVALVYESMNYTAGDGVLHGKTGDDGFSGPWVLNPTASGKIAEPGMTYTDGAGNSTAQKGNHFETRSGYNDVGYAPLDVSLWSAANTDGGKLNRKGAEIWFSVLMNTVNNNNNHFHLYFGDAQPGWNTGPGYFAVGRANVSNAKWEIRGDNDDGDSDQLATSTESATVDTFIVGRLKTDGTSGDTTMDVWFDPLLDTAPGGPGTGDLTITVPANDDGSVPQIDRLGYLHQKWESPNLLDEIRMGESFNSVVGKDVAILSTDPADEETGVFSSANLVATFNKEIALTGSGTITLTDTADGSGTVVINLPDPAQVSVSGADLIINPTDNLAVNTPYEVEIDGDAIEDTWTTPNAFIGTTAGQWNFTTLDESDPSVTTNGGPDNIGIGTATLHGLLTAGGGATAYICWGVNDGGTSGTSSWANVISMGSVIETVSFSTNVSGLIYGIEYDYRVYAENGQGSGWSDVASFTTLVPEISAPPATAGADFETDAGQDTDGDDRWEDVTPGNPTGFELLADNSPAVNRVAVTSSTQLTHAYELPGGSVNNEAGLLPVLVGTTTQRSFQEAPNDWSNNPVTLEIWFKPDNLTPTPSNGQILFEDGGGTGLGLFIDNNELVLAHDSNVNQITYNLNTDPLGVLLASATTEFIQVVVTHDTVSPYQSVMYVNGVAVGTSNNNNDWSGGDAAGFGTRGDDNVGGRGGGQQNTESFDGQIALIRVYYDTILTPAEVAANFDSETIFPASLLSMANNAATNITGSTADLVGILDGTQSVFTVLAYYSQNPNNTREDWINDTTKLFVEAGTYTNVSDHSVTGHVSTLSPGQTYYYTMMASNAVTNIWATPSVEFTTPAPSSDCDMLSLSWNGNSGVIVGTDVTLTVPYGTVVTALDPTFTISLGATAVPPSGTARNFTTPQSYTITAENGVDEQTYTVTVVVTPASTACDMLSLSWNGIDGAIAGTDVTLTVPYGTDVTALDPTFTISLGATAVPPSGTGRNFTTPQSYTITAENGVDFKTYTVTVVVTPASTACDMLSLSWSGIDAVFDGTDVTLNVPKGTSLASVNPTYTVSPLATGSPVSGTAPGFDTDNPQTYTITAQDGATTKDYTVTVVVLPLVYESMNYTSGDGVLHGKTGDAGFSGAWVLNPIDSGRIDAPGMSYTDSAGNTLVTKGSRFETRSGYNDVGYAPIDVSLWSAANTDGGKLNRKGAEIWFSVLMNTVNNQYNHFHLYFGDAQPGWNTGPGYFAVGRATVANAKWEIRGDNDDGDSDRVATSTVSATVDTFIVGRLKTDGTSGDTTMDVWLNPQEVVASAAPGTGDLTITVPANNDGSVPQIDRLGYLHQKHESPNLLDEIRMGESFGEVVPMISPPPTLFIFR